MALEIKQGLKTSLNLALSQTLKHSLAILGFGRNELEKYVNDELEKNPCLEGDAKYEEKDSQRQVDDLRQILQETYSHADYRKQLTDKQSSETLSFANKNMDFPDESAHFSLYDNINEQLSTSRLSPYELECAQVLLQYIGDNGFLNTDLTEIAKNNSIHLDDLKFALETIQKCEPIGIGARSLQECLLLQLNKIEKIPAYVKNILENNWSDFEKQNLQAIAKDESADIEEIKEAFRFIKTHLDPKPARQFGSQTSQFIIPDVYVFKRDEKWICSLNEDGLPRVRLSKKYVQLVQEIKQHKNTQEQKEAYKYINENIKSAKSLIKSLEEREKTILKVTEVILKYQYSFFDNGNEFLVPMTLKVIAQELNLHESTISRATAAKYLHSPRGIYELKYFFNTAVENNAGTELANESVKQWVQDYIKNENKEKPLSDQAIVELIAKEKQLKIARRTVTKYRESLGLLSSTKRAQKF